MSYEAICALPASARVRQVSELMRDIGYAKATVSPFWHGDKALAAYSWQEPHDYRSHVGIYAELARHEEALRIYLRSNAGASYWDLLKLNDSIRAIRRRFKGRFHSDHGANRYFELPDHIQSPSESGCELAFLRFENAMSRASLYLATRGFPDQFRKTPLVDVLALYSPWTLSNNLLVPYIVASIEEYFRATFVALLEYSPRKVSVLKSARLNADQLVRMSEKKLTVEEAVAEGFSFQNLTSVSELFRGVIPDLDVHGTLRRPYRRRRLSLWESLTSLIDRRHDIIHGGEIRADFGDELLGRTIVDVQVAVDRVYRRICELSGWPEPYKTTYRRPTMHVNDTTPNQAMEPTAPGAA